MLGLCLSKLNHVPECLGLSVRLSIQAVDEHVHPELLLELDDAFTHEGQTLLLCQSAEYVGTEIEG